MFARNWCPTRRPTRSTRVAVRRDVARLERKAEISWRDRCRRSKPRSTAASHTSVTRYSYPPIDRWTTRESREKKTLIDGLFGDGPIYNVWQSGSSYVTECDYINGDIILNIPLTFKFEFSIDEVEFFFSQPDFQLKKELATTWSRHQAAELPPAPVESTLPTARVLLLLVLVMEAWWNRYNFNLS